MDFGDFIVYALIILGISFARYVNQETRKYINKWSTENNYLIINKRFFPFYIMIWPWGLTGLHPASFEVTIKDKNNHKRQFKISGGGPLWFSGEFEVEEIKNKKRI